MDKQKAIQIINDAPDDWEYFATSNERFYKKTFDRWFFFNLSHWVECEKLTPLYSTRASMIPKSEILKIAEGEEMKYPYIGKDSHKQIYLMLSNSDALTMDSAAFTHTPIEEGGYKNITHEYLQNTYGEVLSPEHAEFIIKLAENAGFEFTTGTNKYYPCWFTFDDELYFFKSKVYASNDSRKQITIPLPPKFNKTSEILNPNNADVKLSSKPDPLKNAGDNLILGCEQDFKKARAVASDLRKDMGCGDELLNKVDEWKVIEEDAKELDFISRAYTPLESKDDEWPQVGSTVNLKDDKYNDGACEVVRIKVNSSGVKMALLCRISDDHPLWSPVSNLVKPKTPEEELRDEIVQLIEDADGFNPKVLARALMCIYDITKKPQ